MRTAIFMLALAAAAGAEEKPPPPPEDEPWSLDLTVHDVGIGIGNSKHIDGLRMNFRDVAPCVQLGLVNWAANNPSGLKILPIAKSERSDKGRSGNSLPCSACSGAYQSLARPADTEAGSRRGDRGDDD